LQLRDSVIASVCDECATLRHPSVIAERIDICGIDVRRDSRSQRQLTREMRFRGAATTRARRCDDRAAKKFS
jgi:hypothetical protein